MAAIDSSLQRETIPRSYHVLAAIFVAWCVWLALRYPDAYSGAMQEDRVVEWATTLFFAAAGVVGLVGAIRRRRVFDGLVALFCVFVAGEEISWGQRLLGLKPPAYFLEYNTQQEMNLHNFRGLFGSPKWPLVVVLVGFAVVLPLMAMSPRGRRILERVGATPPPVPAIPWFAAAIVLLVWYPLKFTGEWVELLVGSAFFIARGIGTIPLFVSSATVGALSVALAAWSAKGGSDPARVACANAEVDALADGLVHGGATDDLLGARSVHKRVWTMANEGYVDLDSLEPRIAAVSCSGEADSGTRRRFGVDPWGTAYWLSVEREAGRSVATVYSFGPNRRRDIDVAAGNGGDDIAARTTIPAP